MYCRSTNNNATKAQSRILKIEINRKQILHPFSKQYCHYIDHIKQYSNVAPQFIISIYLFKSNQRGLQSWIHLKCFKRIQNIDLFAWQKDLDLPLILLGKYFINGTLSFSLYLSLILTQSFSISFHSCQILSCDISLETSWKDYHLKEIY